MPLGSANRLAFWALSSVHIFLLRASFPPRCLEMSPALPPSHPRVLIIFTAHLPPWMRDKKLEILRTIDTDMLDNSKSSLPEVGSLEALPKETLLKNFEDMNAALKALCASEAWELPLALSFFKLTPECQSRQPVHWQRLKKTVLETVRNQEYAYRHLHNLKAILKYNFSVDTPRVCTDDAEQLVADEASAAALIAANRAREVAMFDNTILTLRNHISAAQYDFKILIVDQLGLNIPEQYEKEKARRVQLSFLKLMQTEDLLELLVSAETEIFKYGQAEKVIVSHLMQKRLFSNKTRRQKERRLGEIVLAVDKLLHQCREIKIALEDRQLNVAIKYEDGSG